jgi:hypothetical protein
MISRDQCPICYSKPTKSTPAHLSEFIRIRGGIELDEISELQAHYCLDCNFSFISKGYSNEEAERIYRDYRGNSYNAQRVELEASYADLINQFEDHNSLYFETRIGVLEKILREYPGHFIGGTSRTILDFGSSDPYIVEEAFKRAGLSHGRILCFDIGQSFADINFKDISCIFVNHILEHLSDFDLFRDLMKRVLDHVPIYIELPVDYLGELDLVFRTCAENLSVCSINVAHEHINFFSREAIRRLAESSGISVDEVTLRPWNNSFVLSSFGRVNVRRDVFELTRKVYALTQIVSERDKEIEYFKQTIDENKINLSKLNQTISEFRSHCDHLSQAIDERDVQIIKLKQVIDDRNIDNAELTQTIENRNFQIDRLNQIVDERNAQISGMQKNSNEQSSYIANLKQEINNCQRQLVELTNSTSWKITKPIRQLGKIKSVTIWPFLYVLIRFLKHPSLSPYRRYQEYLVIRQNFLFDRDFYLKSNPDIIQSGLDPALHYVFHGAVEGRKPIPLFDSAWYLSQYPDVAAAGINPLVHYLNYGAPEGRQPNPLFDSAWYLSQYPDIAAVGLNPLVHYLNHGAAEGRKPSPLFDSAWYLEQYQDVAAAGLNPLEHYIYFGAAEGRCPMPI